MQTLVLTKGRDSIQVDLWKNQVTRTESLHKFFESVFQTSAAVHTEDIQHLISSTVKAL